MRRCALEGETQFLPRRQHCGGAHREVEPGVEADVIQLGEGDAGVSLTGKPAQGPPVQRQARAGVHIKVTKCRKREEAERANNPPGCREQQIGSPHKHPDADHGKRGASVSPLPGPFVRGVSVRP